jgi:hypothetical protein
MLQRYIPNPSKLFAELLIIVVGVLIALGIDEWRERIANAELENIYLEQLIADLEETERKMADVSQLNMASLAATQSILAAFENPEAAKSDRINNLLIEMASFNNPVPVLGTVEALVSTGDLQLIRSAEIRSAITRYMSRTRDFYLIPLYQAEEHHREYYFRISKIAVEYGLTPRGRESEHRRNIEPDIGGFLADSGAYAEAVFFAGMTAEFKFYRDEVATDAKEFRQLLESSVSPD